MVLCILQRRLLRCLFLWWDFCRLISKSFLIFQRYFFLIFSIISACLMVSTFQYSQVLVVFFFSKCSKVFLIWNFYSFWCFSFSFFHYHQGTFFSAKFYISWLYILTVCMKISRSFSVLANTFILSMYIRWLIFSCDFVNL